MEKKELLRAIKSGEQSILDVPKDFATDSDIIKTERRLKLRMLDRVGYDVVRDKFYVEENLKDVRHIKREAKLHNKTIKTKDIPGRSEITWFVDFSKFYAFVDGEIYGNACYYQLDPARIDIDVDVDKICRLTISTKDTFEGRRLTFGNVDDSELIEFDEIEERKPIIRDWSKRFIGCNSYDELVSLIAEYEESELFQACNVDVRVFLWQYIMHDTKDKKRFSVVMKCINNGNIPRDLIYPLCHVFPSEDVMESFDPKWNLAESTIIKKKKELRKYIKCISESESESEFGFIEELHYYTCRTTYRCMMDGWPNCERTYLIFETYEDLQKVFGDSLPSGIVEVDYYREEIVGQIQERIKRRESAYSLQKWCDSSLKYHVKEILDYKDGSVPKGQSFEFEYFYDFVHFLEGDLSGADLVNCTDGLLRLHDLEGINFEGAKVLSVVASYLGIPRQSYIIPRQSLVGLRETEEAEEESALMLLPENRKENLDFLGNIHGLANYERMDATVYKNKTLENRAQSVAYITDLHLEFRLDMFRQQLGQDCLTIDDVDYVINSLVETIVGGGGDRCNTILIGGDVASDFELYKMFVEKLGEKKYKSQEIIFTLGNHELWGFAGKEICEIVQIYRRLLEENGMHLLHNEIIYINQECPRYFYVNLPHRIDTERLSSMSAKELQKEVQTAFLVIFGGIGFSGKDDVFNANNGIYRNTISREKEIAESDRFQSLYEKILTVFPERQVIVCSHMPMHCWNGNTVYHGGYIYVSGHTHRNRFYDDNDVRVFEDNQVGYKCDNPQMKSFSIDGRFEAFLDYADGIYQISREEYYTFYRGVGIQMSFNRGFEALYMLKKHGYYCFLYEGANKRLYILNGGSGKTLQYTDIQYYYDNMDRVVESVAGPLATYTKIQRRVAEEVRKIGGDGFIHGCIVDIDWYNHIYVNPVDLKITGYWARNIEDKLIYPSIRDLLISECPALYANYEKLEKGDSESIPIMLMDRKRHEQDMEKGLIVGPKRVFSTEMYQESRRVKELQRLQSNILTVWYEIADDSHQSLSIEQRR